ncbi:hypothetical protein BJY04DRAFT_477 [Aspergillus karnatakaensis]|uniref:uncharacterized protein n=1 Tax=Aspergillus karnatakaensis TaxID=1810916 RepID=UPI003CCD6372
MKDPSSPPHWVWVSKPYSVAGLHIIGPQPIDVHKSSRSSYIYASNTIDEDYLPEVRNGAWVRKENIDSLITFVQLGTCCSFLIFMLSGNARANLKRSNGELNRCAINPNSGC